MCIHIYIYIYIFICLKGHLRACVTCVVCMRVRFDARRGFDRAQ